VATKAHPIAKIATVGVWAYAGARIKTGGTAPSVILDMPCNSRLRISAPTSMLVVSMAKSEQAEIEREIGQ
jgi:hypothetical protein